MSEQVDSSASTDGKLADDAEMESMGKHSPNEEEGTSLEQVKV